MALQTHHQRSVTGPNATMMLIGCFRYGGGGGEDMSRNLYYRRLRAATEGYDEVIMVGDSMGATAALLFSSLATSAHAFCPQVIIRCDRPQRRESQQLSGLSFVDMIMICSISCNAIHYSRCHQKLLQEQRC